MRDRHFPLKFEEPDSGGLEAGEPVHRDEPHDATALWKDSNRG